MDKKAKPLSYLWVGLGSLSLALGVIGIFLPLLPTTPFLLVAAFCYARGSPRLHAWLLNHPRFGRPIRDWEEDRVIRLRVKVLVTVMMAVSMSFPLFIIAKVPPPARIVIGVIGLAVLTFIWLQKSEPAANGQKRSPPSRPGKAAPPRPKG